MVFTQAFSHNAVSNSFRLIIPRPCITHCKYLVLLFSSSSPVRTRFNSLLCDFFNEPVDAEEEEAARLRLVARHHQSSLRGDQ